MTGKGYNKACYDLAGHFLGSDASPKLRVSLAYHAQVAVETWIDTHRDEIVESLKRRSS